MPPELRENPEDETVPSGACANPLPAIEVNA